jgi:hypothetical protein
VAATGALIGVGTPIAANAYQKHKVGIERAEARDQRQIGRIIRPGLKAAGQEFITAYNHDHSKGWTVTRTPDGKYEILQEPDQGGNSGEAIVDFKTVHTAQGDKKVPDARKTVWADWQMNNQSANTISGFVMTAPGGVRQAQTMNVLVPDSLQGERG